MMIKTQAHQIVNQATIKQSIKRNTARHTQPPVGPVTPLTYISRDAQRHRANLNAGPLALRIRLYQPHCISSSYQMQQPWTADMRQ
jgi:hypothetical protein